VTAARASRAVSAAPVRPATGDGRGLSVRRDPLDRGTPIGYNLLFPDALETGDTADRAHAAGYEAGYSDGKREAEKEAGEAAGAVLARVERAVSALSRSTDAARVADEERRAELERVVPGFAFDLLETLFGRESVLASDPGRDAIARALALDESTLPAIARLSPDDAATIGEFADLAPSRSLTVVADPAVEPGGALVEIGSTTIDSQLSAALARVRAVIAGPVEREAQA
jgi:flagellar assembly protein FliH